MRNIKKLLDLILLTSIALMASFLFNEVYAATCTSISRTNASALSVLTSTKYNTDLNTAYTALNAFDAGCVAPGSLEFDALNTTQFAPVLKGIKEGCKVSYSNASTLVISECLAAVNGNFVTTTVDTSVSFGCTGCSAEVATTDYYVYIQTGSSGSTLTPLILTGAPNEDGYDNTGNKVLARFHNNNISDIDQNSIDQWYNNSFLNENSVKTPGAETFLCSANISASGVISEQKGGCFDSCTNATTPVCTFTANYWAEIPSCWHSVTGALTGATTVTSTTIQGLNLNTSAVAVNGPRSYFCHGLRY